MGQPDFCIAGAGIIGLSLALELHRRGATVTVLEQDTPLAQASTAAAGMLAAEDSENPPQLKPLADFSISLYPAWLARIELLSAIRVPFQTAVTLQSFDSRAALPVTAAMDLLPQLVPGSHRFVRLDEHSLDPRQLAQSLLAAVRATGIDLRTHTPVLSVRSLTDSVEIATPSSHLSALRFIDCTGAWAGVSASLPPSTVVPRKGQMLSVALPPSLPLDLVVRTPAIYIVPRTQGPNAGRAIIGATIEDKGFDKTVHSADIASLHAQAAALLPPLATATVLESWAGLRPATPDGLPLLGALPGRPHHLVATGHYRNGILLAPATAQVLADLVTGVAPSIDVTAFSPARFRS
jgi:glycine oxidase